MTIPNSHLSINSNAFASTSNSRKYQPSPLASSSSDPPSSPSSTSFYSLPRRHNANGNQRSYQSTNSVRSTPNSTNSNSTSLRTQTLSNARLARRSSIDRREISSDTGNEVSPFEIGPQAFESGSYSKKDQSWELYTEEEQRILDFKTTIEGKRRKDLLLERAELEGIGEDDENSYIEEEEEILSGGREEEPPSDIYGEEEDESQYSIPNLPPENPLFLPSLASDPHSSSQIMDVDIDESSGESQESTNSNSKYPSFAEVLLNGNCPCCGVENVIGVKEEGEGGVECKNCSWGIRMDLLKALEFSFISHSSIDHLPLFGWNQYTSTIILCSKCDAEFAV